MRSKFLAITLTAFFALIPAAQAHNSTPKGGGHTPVTICHHAGPTKVFTLVVDDDAVADHVAQHGDTIGPCPGPPVTPPPVTPPVTPPACVGGPPVVVKYENGTVISTVNGCGETVYVIVTNPATLASPAPSPCCCPATSAKPVAKTKKHHAKKHRRRGPHPHAKRVAKKHRHAAPRFAG